MNYHSPEKVLKLARDFMDCRILLTGAELDLFTLLGRERLDLKGVADRTGTRTRGLAVLLDALAAMGLLNKEGGLYSCPDDVRRVLSADSPVSVLPMVLHCVSLWERWSCLTEIVRGAECEFSPPFQKIDELRAFIGAMHVVAAPLAPGIVSAVNPGGSRMLLDVGGASGTYTIAFLETAAGMKATLFDRPPVVAMARERLEKAGLLDRVKLVAGDFYRDEFPSGHDLAFISAIIHQNSREQNRDLFGKVFRALVKGGRVVIRDHVMDEDRVRPDAGAVFAVNMLVATAGGGTYTFAEIAEDLSQSGFSNIRLLKAGGHMDSLVEAFKD